MNDDYFTNTVEDAARCERMRAEPEDRPSASDFAVDDGYDYPRVTGDLARYVGACDKTCEDGQVCGGIDDFHACDCPEVQP